MTLERIQDASALRTYTVVRVSNDPLDTHAAETFEDALTLAMPDDGATVHYGTVTARDAGAARLMKPVRWSLYTTGAFGAMATNYADLQREHDAADTSLRLQLGTGYSLLSSEEMQRARAEWIRNERGIRDPQRAAEIREEKEASYARSLRNIGKAGACAVFAAFLSLPAFAEPCKVNVNTASPQELQLLSRTGPVLAARIVVARPLDAPKLDAVKGIGPSWLAANGPHVAFSGPTTCTEKIKAAPKVAAQGPKL